MADKDSRNHARRRTLLAGKLLCDDGRNTACICRDLSVSGAKVTADGPFQKGDEILLRLDKFDELIRGEIVWRREGSFGLIFRPAMSVIPESMRELMKPLTS